LSLALTTRIKIVLVLVLVLVLEKWGWVGEVLEYCAKSELHPRSGLGMLTRRFVPRLRRRASSGACLACEADFQLGGSAKRGATTNIMGRGLGESVCLIAAPVSALVT
jgi:hypothetical protein